jgi:predicted nucleic acid-binding protein
MGQIVLPPAGLVYVDTNAVIYFVEKIEPYQTASAPLWDALNAGQPEIVTSELTLLEVLVKPLRDGNQALATFYRSLLLGTMGLTCVPIRRTILQGAAGIRAAHSLKTPNAIHAASALDIGCTLFVTNGSGFRRVSGLHVAVLSEVAAT